MPHPPLSRRTPSVVSAGASPRTPACGSPAQLPVFLSYAANRKSSDSWNSSNDPAEDLESDWMPEQTLLISRTLDALPSHILTPFIGPVPPSNLLDKLARGLVDAKSTSEWPHSVRATRFKLVELARERARDAAPATIRSETIDEEEDGHRDALKPTTNTGSRRPLYRQSSMDFMQSAKLDLGDSDPYSRAAERLHGQERDRHREPLDPSHIPLLLCSHHGKSRSPHGFAHSLHPSTPSSTTLHSTRSARSSRGSLRRTASTLSISSSAADLCVWEAEAPAGPSPHPVDTFDGGRQPLKRAPAFGVSKLDKPTVKPRNSTGNASLSGSDEEEKLRAKKAKKPRTAKRETDSATPKDSIATTKNSSRSTTSPCSITLTCATVPKHASARKVTTAHKEKQQSSTDPRPVESPQRSRPRRNLQRNPSMFGPELPNPQVTPSPPSSQYFTTHQFASPILSSPQSMGSPPATSPSVQSQSQTPRSPPPSTPRRTLRRTRPTTLRPARRISFGSFAHAAEEADCQNMPSLHPPSGSLLLEPVEIRMFEDPGSRPAVDAGLDFELGSAFELY